MAIGAKVKRARQAGVPLLAVASADQIAVVQEVAASINGDAPVLSWDCISGWVALNKPGQEVVSSLPGDPAEITAPFIESMRAAASYLPAGGTLLCINSHLQIRNESGAPQVGAIQAVSNLRDLFKSDGRVLVLLGAAWSIPAELRESVIALDEDLPGRDALQSLIVTICEGAGVPVPGGDAMEEAVDALSGLSLFAAEQSIALSIGKSGLNQSALWERKRKAIEQVPGLRVLPSDVNYAMVGGCRGFKDELSAIMRGPMAPRVVVLIDEIEKAMAGSGGGDLSGVSSDQLGVMLSSMSENNWTGIILVGPPGASKSWLATSLPGEFSCQGVGFDLGACKGSLVGESEQKIRAAMTTILAIGGPRVLFVATSNGIQSLKPELRRRFSCGTWFADLCDPDERRQVLTISLKRFGHEMTQAEMDEFIRLSEGWSAANIKDCCFVAQMKGCKPIESMGSVIPAARMDPEGIDRLRRDAAGKYNSVSTGKVYTVTMGAQVAGARRVNLGGE